MIVEGFLFPDELHYQVEDQVWARLVGDGTAVVGITALGIRLAGEVYMCRPKSAGAQVEQGRGIAVVELAKSIVSVKSPVSGTVLEPNEALATRPELIHEDCYGQGWIARLQLKDWALDAPQLLQGADVEPAMRRHAQLFRAGEPEAGP